MSRTWDFAFVNTPVKFPSEQSVRFQQSVDCLSDTKNDDRHLRFTIGPTWFHSPLAMRTVYFRIGNQKKPKNGELQRNASYTDSSGRKVRVYLDKQE